MNHALTLLCAACCVLWAVAARADPPENGRPAATVTAKEPSAAESPDSAVRNREDTAAALPPGTDVLFTGGRRLVVVRFQILVDGRPSGEQWNAYLDGLFQRVDRNGDGRLDSDERRQLPSRRLFEALNLVDAQQGIGTSLLQQDPRMFADDHEGLSRYFERIGFRPVRMASPPARSGQIALASGRAVPGRAAQVGMELYSLLDMDGDGELDEHELRHAAERVRQNDFDRDEALSATELTPVTVGTVLQVDPRMAAAASPRLQIPFIMLDDSTSPRERARHTMSQLAGSERNSDKARLQTISRSAVDHPAALFDQYDRNGNGEISFEELADFLESPRPDVLLTLRYGKRNSGERPLEATFTSELKFELARGPMTLNLSLDGVELVLAQRAAAATAPAVRLKQMFDRAETDNNGYLDRNEARRLGAMSNAFTELDRDRNGQLFFDEFQQGLEPILEAGDQQYHVGVNAGAFDFFLALDSSGDQRLTARELQELPRRVLAWDRNQDGRTGRGELPQRYELSISTDPSTGSVRADAYQASRPRPVRRSGVRTLLGTVVPPTWFQRMDRNEDGDISPLEFLGTESDFRNYDRDGDGLISGAEAMQKSSP